MSTIDASEVYETEEKELKSAKPGVFVVVALPDRFYCSFVRVFGNNGVLYMENAVANKAITTMDDIAAKANEPVDYNRIAVMEQVMFNSGEWKQMRTAFESEIEIYNRIMKAQNVGSEG